ncbi:CBN-NPP-3 protein [Caenorhabditis brenneri]|uniref:CBN-NPP-3 protein n=1 Tax=Caenorhabditis brenneri TaxID=135651 RepID=G0NR58_CAEBE|nr:CBN-NPP-3 protein [Caenorhabditis brenneri]
MWIEIRKFYDFVTTFTEFDDDDKLDDLFLSLEKYRWRLTNVLQNPRKTVIDREKIKANGTVDIGGVELSMDQQICSEAIIISDCFQLNEIDAVDLVLSGEAQKIHFEGLNRGLIAVVCYYDAHRLLIAVMRHMLKWDREDVPTRITTFLEETYLTEKMIKNLFQKLTALTVQNEFARLQNPEINGLGSSKHQKLLRNAIEEIRSEIIGSISLICEFPGSAGVAISNFLFGIVKAVPPERLNATNMTAWVSLVKLTSSEVLSQVQDAQNVLTNMITHIRNETDWSDQAMCGTLQLACAVSLKSIASSPSDHLGIENIKVDVERVIDRAIRNLALQYLRRAIIQSENFRYAHQFIIIDELLKQLVAYFPAKLLETERNSTDELFALDDQQKQVAASTSKPDPRNQTVNITDKITAQITTTDSTGNYETAMSHYENFLRCFVDLYEMQVTDFVHRKNAKTTRERELQEQIEESSMSFSTERSIELCRLLERSRLPNHHVVHTVAYLELCAAVCKNQLTAGLLYDVFSKEHGGPDSYGWDSLSSALKGYDRLFREQKSQSNSRFNQSQSMNMSASFHQQNQPSLNLTLRPGDKICIRSQELSGLVAWLHMATKVATFNENAAMRFSDDPSWTMSSAVASLATSPVPLSLKAALLDLLTSLARLKGTAPRIWQVIHTNRLCYHADGGTLMGMQQELEQRECIEKDYSVSLAFVKLMTTLLMHRSIPEYATPFIQYVTRSILGHFANRSYNSVIQMWELAEWSLRATNALLEFGIVEPRAVAQNDVHICILTQCLNDSPMFRAITRVVMEDCQAHNDPYTSRQAPSSDAALIALRILSRAIILHPALRACARVSSGDIMVASITSLVFSPITSATACTLLDLIFHYIHMTDDYPVHSLYAARILRDVMATRGAVEAKMLEILRSRNSAPSHVRAVRTAICATSIQYTIDDSLSKEEDTDNPNFARGETARLLLETLSDAIDSHVLRSGNRVTDFMNICYYLLAFRPSKANSKELYEADDALTGMHYVLHIIEQFVQSEKPFDLPFSALIEPAFRLMQRLVATSSPFSQPVLCFMRSSNIIERLATSPFICSALKLENEKDNTYAQGIFAVRRMIVGYILHFSAVEISAMLTTGHFSRPEKLYRALLESSSLVAEYTEEDMDNDEYVAVDTRPPGSDGNPNLLFSLLRRATVPRHNKLDHPDLVHFDFTKLQEVFDACLTVNIYGVAQYDVCYLNRLLRREIEAVYTDSSVMRYVQDELEKVLKYCTEINASLLSESASERIVSGCTALLSVFSVFAPVHFFSNRMQ